MKNYRKQEVVEKHTKHIITSVVCNKCGKTEELVGEDYEMEWQANKFQSMGCSFGYGSRYDRESWDFDLCEDCLTEFIKTFKIVPNGFGQDSYIAMHPQIMFDKWKETGIVDLEAGMSKEEIAKNGGSIYVDYDGEEDE